jgi:small-conductance mechanosensitive channel
MSEKRVKPADIARLIFNLSVVIALLVFRSFYASLMTHVDFSPRFEKHLFLVIISVALLSVVRRSLIMGFRLRKPDKKADNIILGTGLIIRVFHVAFAILLGLSFFDVSIGEALSTISLIAVALTLITKDYISSTLNGMILAFSDHVQLDDYVSIGDFKGKIQAITLSHLQLLTDDDDIVFIPNNKVFVSEVTNYTRRAIKKSSLDFEIDPLVHGDVDKLEAFLIEAMKPMNQYIKTETFNLKVVQMKEKTVHLKFQYVLLDPANKDLERKTRRYCARRIIEFLNKKD